MKFQELQGWMEELAPLRYAYDWDNSGVNLYLHDDVERILVCLEVTPAVVEEAEAPRPVDARAPTPSPRPDAMGESTATHRWAKTAPPPRLVAGRPTAPTGAPASPERSGSRAAAA